MTERTTKPKYVLLDANVIIKAYELSIWDRMLESITIYVPSIVVHNEALFFSKEIDRIPQEINLPRLVTEEKIIELTASAEELQSVYSMFDSVFNLSLHAGESEALALLLAEKAGDAHFCTGDKKAIQALAMLDLGDRGISMENLLKKIGMQRALPAEYCENFFKRHLSIGHQNRITGEGMA